MTDHPKKEITREMFIAATGYEPVNDDLERCNCPDAGKIGHQSCGWNDVDNIPNFMPITNIKPGWRDK